MNFDLMRSLLIDRALRGELSAYSNSVAAEEKSLNEQKTKPFQIPYDWQWKCVADCVQFNPKVIQDDTAEVSFLWQTLSRGLWINVQRGRQSCGPRLRKVFLGSKKEISWSRKLLHAFRIESLALLRI